MQIQAWAFEKVGGLLHFILNAIKKVRNAWPINTIMARMSFYNKRGKNLVYSSNCLGIQAKGNGLAAIFSKTHAWIIIIVYLYFLHLRGYAHAAAGLPNAPPRRITAVLQAALLLCAAAKALQFYRSHLFENEMIVIASFIQWQRAA